MFLSSFTRRTCRVHFLRDIFTKIYLEKYYKNLSVFLLPDLSCCYDDFFFSTKKVVLEVILVASIFCTMSVSLFQLKPNIFQQFWLKVQPKYKWCRISPLPGMLGVALVLFMLHAISCAHTNVLDKNNNKVLFTPFKAKNIVNWSFYYIFLAPSHLWHILAQHTGHVILLSCAV